MINITIVDGEKERLFRAENGKTILEVLRDNGLYVPAICSGRGVCGKCGVRTDGTFEITAQDAVFYNEEQLTKGMRLSCCTVANEDCRIILPEVSEEGFSVLTAYKDDNQSCVTDISGEPSYGIAVDIGTTTIGIALVDLHNDRSIGVYSAVNRQRKYGADVISRIQSSCEGRLDELKKLVQEDIYSGIQELTKSHDIPAEEINKIMVAGNTVMLHLFLGKPCGNLGHSPFKAEFTGGVELPFREVFGHDALACGVILLPCVSAFIGSDITAGLGLLRANRCEETFLFIDIGTNGEMVLVNNGRVICTATAAGPAFEGGNIFCGTGSVPGAISHVRYIDGGFVCETINNRPVSGLCGSGVIDLTACLLDNGMLDETGLLEEGFTEGGIDVTERIVFTQKDIREVQLAKSAIRSGIECLIDTVGLSYGDLDKVYLAGGFGYQVNLENAAKIGLIPREITSSIETVGNSSLGGCIKALLSGEVYTSIYRVASSSTEINLAEYELFNGLFIDNMYFEP